MALMSHIISLALFLASTTNALIASSRSCPCYTATTYPSNPACVPLDPQGPCWELPCVRYTTTTIPGYNAECTSTPTVTSLLPCKTACSLDCLTISSTRTLGSGRCLPPSWSQLAPTVTIPQSTSSCYTSTTTLKGHCPEDDLSCPSPDCVYLSTTTVPGGVVAGCETTPTVTENRTCKGRCDGSCGTQWVTETAAVRKRD
ncbi:hypothetical protein PSPO01_05711 [Paraphaeosphaeria sporulosa]